VRWLEDNAVIARAADGRPVRFDGVASDITERKWHEAQVLYLATYDALTDLPNRNLLSDRLTQDMARAQRGGRTVSVLVLGLDRFKLINDSYGHNFGDALLRELATRLRSSAEETGLIVPIGAWVLRAACAQNKAWQDAGLPHLRMGVNVSANQFWGGRIANTVSRVLKETGFLSAI
jgi:predicted signal transduction protein with EAL and GGDEF domain